MAGLGRAAPEDLSLLLLEPPLKFVRTGDIEAEAP
jgi:hypothetical protein